jgi:hypothetical protein
LRRTSGSTPRQKKLIDSLLETDDEELFDEGFRKRILIELVSFMHDWHLRTTARRFRDGDIPSALLWLQDVKHLSQFQAQIEAIEVANCKPDPGES